MSRTVAWCLLAALLVAANSPGCPAQAQSVDLKAGKKVYDQVCLECHGKKGGGDGEKAKRLGFVSRDFSLGVFKCRCTPSGALPSDDDLMRTVANGLPGSPMSGNASELSEAERRAVVEYVKTFSPRFAAELPPACLPIPEPPPADDLLIAEGQQIYRLLSCGSCHGARGAADGPAAEGLTDDWGDPIRVHDFARRGKFKCGGEPRDLYRTLHTGLTGTPMPSYEMAFDIPSDGVELGALRSALGDQAVEEVAAYVARQPSSAELEMMTAAQRQALIEHRTWALVHFVKSLAPAGGGED
jgi:mono/diheme cytochrome c family protein